MFDHCSGSRNVLAVAIGLVILSCAGSLAADTFYVATTGSDSNPGTSELLPWRTIQRAASSATPGSTVLIAGGIYSERVSINVDGNATAGPIVFRRKNNDLVVIDGTGITPPAGDSGLVTISGRNYITLDGLQIANYVTTVAARTPIGIYIDQRGSNITLRDLVVRDVKNTANAANANAHLIAAYARDGAVPISQLAIENCELFNGVLGASEALTVNGNVDGFRIVGNRVHHVNNIAIVMIGWEQVAPANDQARGGLVADNLVYEVTSFGNPAYGTDRSAGGIYCDGCRDTVIERNVVHHADLGIEVGNEHLNKTTTNVIVRENLLYRNQIAGLAFGGYAANRGIVTACRFTQNTLVENDTTNSGSGEIVIQRAHDNLLEGNILLTSAQAIGYSNYFGPANSYNNTTRYQLIWSPGGAPTTFVWVNNEYTGLAAMQALGLEVQSLALDPQLVNPSVVAPDLHLQASSPAIDRGDPAFVTGAAETDADRNPRIWNTRVDIGAYEYGSQPCLVVPGPAAGVSVVRLSGFTARVGWPVVATASAYDVVRGSLGVLLSSLGNYSVATDACVVNATTQAFVDDPTIVGAGNGLWYLVRGENCAGAGTYDETGTGQQAPRDAELALSASACP